MNLGVMQFEVFSYHCFLGVRQVAVASVARLTRPILVDADHSTVLLQFLLESFDGTRLAFLDRSVVLIAPVSESHYRSLSAS